MEFDIILIHLLSLSSPLTSEWHKLLEHKQLPSEKHVKFYTHMHRPLF